VNVRPADRQDLPAINAIYNHYVAASHCTFDLAPIALERRETWFEQFAREGPHRLFVAETDGDIIGFTYSSTLRPRPAYDTSVESTVYVRDGAVGAGVGAALYGALFEALGTQPIHRVYAGIALPNDASVRLHERFGFIQTGVWHEVGNKFGRYWDVAWFEKSGLGG